MDIVKPVFIVGVGRSGSTAFHGMLSRHPDVAWLSTFCERFPRRTWINRVLMKSLDLPLIGSHLQQIFDPRECWGFWETYARGFSTPCRDLVSKDVTDRAKKRIRGAMARMLTERRRRLLIKITGWPRVGYLEEVFPDAKFVHMMRDGRAVVNSLVNVDWWWGWRGPSNWRLGPLSPELQKEWEDHERSFVALAAIEWRLLMDTMEEARRRLPEGSYMEFKYEDLCSSPIETTRSVLEFCDLDWPSGFGEVVKESQLRSVNYKWKEELTERQRDVIESILHDHLVRYGYT